MRRSLAISGAGHAAVLLWAVVAFAVTPYHSDSPTPMPIDIISATEFSQMTAGSRNAPKQEQAKPLAEKVGEKKIADDPTAKVVEKKEINASTETPPIPEAKPPKPVEKKAEPKPAEKKPEVRQAEKKKAEPKHDLIAEALKKEEQKKTEQKKAEATIAHPPTPPKRPARPQPKFDPKKVEALLDKRAPQRLAATGPVLNDAPSLGTSDGQAAQLSQSELDALRARLAQLWSPPAGAKDPQELIVLVRVRFNRDGTLAGPPIVLSHGQSTIYMAARDSAIRAVFRGQPFDMLRPEHYEQWKDVEITFDPRDMFRG
jgi:colicin import membrane protein